MLDLSADRPLLTRRRLLQLGLALPLPMVLTACDTRLPPTRGEPDHGRSAGHHGGRRRGPRPHPGLRRAATTRPLQTRAPTSPRTRPSGPRC